MARMHARRKGKSGSTRPLGTVSPEWIDVTLKDIEKNVVKWHGPEFLNQK